jgi:hypothetical protein
MYVYDLFKDMSMVNERERELSEINMRQMLAERAREQVCDHV